MLPSMTRKRPKLRLMMVDTSKQLDASIRLGAWKAWGKRHPKIPETIEFGILLVGGCRGSPQIVMLILEKNTGTSLYMKLGVYENHGFSSRLTGLTGDIWE